MRLRPVGPYLPSGREQPGTIDLGVRLRDWIFTSGYVRGPLRASLRDGLKQALEADSGSRAANFLGAYLETWPLAAVVDEAREDWTRGYDGVALTVLARVAELLVLAGGWSRVPAGLWPDAPLEWVREQVGDALVVVERRGDGDGADALARALGADMQPGPTESLPPTVTLAGHALAQQREALCGRLARGELAALHFTSAVPADLESQLALGEVRLESRAQSTLDRYGLAGLLAGSAPELDQLWGPAHAGVSGPALRPVCEGLLLPGPIGAVARGQFDTIGWLVWDGPCAPLPVQPVAVMVLRALDGQRDLAAIAAHLKGPASLVGEVLDHLVALGAATAADEE